MTRLAGGRDGIDAITPEDFIGHDLGPGERSGLARARRERGGRAARRARTRCCSTSASPGPAGELKAQRAPGPDDLDLRAPEGPVRDPRHPADARTSSGSGAGGGGPTRRSAPTTGRGCGTVGVDDTVRDRSRRRATWPGATPGGTSRGSTTPPPTSRSRGSRMWPSGSPRTTSGMLNAESVNTFRLQRGRPALGGTHRVVRSRVALHPRSPSFHHVTALARGGVRVDHVRAQQPRDLGSRESAEPSHFSRISTTRACWSEGIPRRRSS